MKVLFIGDVFGKAGLRVLRNHLPVIKESVDFIIVNMENSAGGFGIHREAAKIALRAGVGAITLGNHTWRHNDVYDLMHNPELFPIIRPLNYEHPETPGVGWRTFEVKTAAGTERLTVVNLLGRVFMEPVGNPFLCMDALLERDDLGAVWVDFHAEATSEKQALGHYLAGRVTAVVGTHTHVATADTRLLEGVTAYQTDAGFTGAYRSVIGSAPEAPVQRHLTQRPHRFVNAETRAELNGVMVEIEGKQAISVERYHYLEAPAEANERLEAQIPYRVQ